MCSACRLMVFNICVKFHENMSSNLTYGADTKVTYGADTKIVNTLRAITPKVGKPYGSCVLSSHGVKHLREVS